MFGAMSAHQLDTRRATDLNPGVCLRDEKHEQVSREVFQQAYGPDKMLVREIVDDFRVAVCIHCSLDELQWVNVHATFPERSMCVPTFEHIG